MAWVSWVQSSRCFDTFVISFTDLMYVVSQAPPVDDDAGLTEAGHVLKYSAYKNLGSLAEKREQWEKSIDAYLQVI